MRAPSDPPGRCSLKVGGGGGVAVGRAYGTIRGVLTGGRPVGRPTQARPCTPGASRCVLLGWLPHTAAPYREEEGVRLAGRDGAAAALALRAELARRASQPTEMLLPGTTPGLVEAALASGLRLTRPPGLLLLGHGTDPPKALAISGYWLL
jgi:hypothetical protein